MPSAASGRLLAAALLLAGCAPNPPPEEPWPGDARAGFAIPELLWRTMHRESGFGELPVGYSPDEIRNFDSGSSRHVPRSLLNLFRDVRDVPRFSGAVAGRLHAEAEHPSKIVRQCASLHGFLVGHRVGPPDLEAARAELGPEAALDAVPEHARRLLLRLVAAGVEAARWLREARDEPHLMRALGVDQPEQATVRVLLPLADVLWTTGQDRPFPRVALEILDRFDLALSARAAAGFLDRVEDAIREYRASPDVQIPPGAPLVMKTALGTVRVGFGGADAHPGGDFLVLDLGGDDAYAGANAAPTDLAHPVGIVVDLSGNDLYDGGDAPAALACGFFGIGALFDLAGNDTYRHGALGLGAGLYGTGFLCDHAGDDSYLTEERGQGVGIVGTGVLADLAGNDRYKCRGAAQGYAGTLGTGLLLDLAGNDSYLSDGWGGPDNPFKEDPVSFAQGASTGRRADMGDGRSLGGGFGILVDGAGDDVYDASVYSGGAGYWWGMGIFEDFSGNDIYRRGPYSCGAAPHFGIGVCVDRAGDDTYNIDNVPGRSRISFGHGRDGGVGVFIDGDGNDRYLFGANCGGGASIQAMGLFWDRRGDDRYEVPPDPKGKMPPACALGTAKAGKDHPWGNFRDRTLGTGLFLDSGGRDTYILPPDPGRRVADGSEWRDSQIPALKGFGLDVEWYPPASRLDVPEAGR